MQLVVLLVFLDVDDLKLCLVLFLSPSSFHLSPITAAKLSWSVCVSVFEHISRTTCPVFAGLFACYSRP